MHRHHAVFTEQGTFFAVRSWADFITNMFGFDLRQAQPARGSASFLQTTATARHSSARVAALCPAAIAPLLEFSKPLAPPNDLL
jgi:hypothetical protein